MLPNTEDNFSAIVFPKAGKWSFIKVVFSPFSPLFWYSSVFFISKSSCLFTTTQTGLWTNRRRASLSGRLPFSRTTSLSERLTLPLNRHHYKQLEKWQLTASAFLTSWMVMLCYGSWVGIARDGRRDCVLRSDYWSLYGWFLTQQKQHDLPLEEAKFASSEKNVCIFAGRNFL